MTKRKLEGLKREAEESQNAFLACACHWVRAAREDYEIDVCGDMGEDLDEWIETLQHLQDTDKEGEGFAVSMAFVAGFHSGFLAGEMSTEAEQATKDLISRALAGLRGGKG